MREITLEELLEAGCHFGHQVTRSNPKAREFIYEARDNIHIIDLIKTKEGLEEAGSFIKDLAAKGGSLIIVGAKRQARGIVEESIRQVHDKGAGEGLYYVINRWIGGMLTNFAEVAKNHKKLKDLTARLQDEEEKAKYTKKEVGQWAKEKAKLESFYLGVAEMKKIPDALFIIDTHLEELAVKEARGMGVTTVGIVDTNADPYLIDYPIPANDDAVGSIKLIVSYIIDAWIEGRGQGENKKPATTEVTDKPATTEDTEKIAEATVRKQRKTVAARKSVVTKSGSK